MVQEALILTALPVTTVEQVEAMRRIRNSCRLFMTRDTREISVGEQAAWWAQLDKTTVAAFVFHVAGVAEPVGYGLARLKDGSWWVSGGLAEDWRGKGLGKQLFGFLLQHSKGFPCWLEVLESNVSGQKTYASLGFVEVKRENGVITMVEGSGT